MTTVYLAVNGTLMRGLELNENLRKVGAQFVREATTAAAYRLWTINDEYAQEFAECFYALLDDESTTVAAATRAARVELRRRYPNNPLWLAYSLYAHPNARVGLVHQD